MVLSERSWPVGYYPPQLYGGHIVFHRSSTDKCQIYDLSARNTSETETWYYNCTEPKPLRRASFDDVSSDSNDEEIDVGDSYDLPHDNDDQVFMPSSPGDPASSYTNNVPEYEREHSCSTDEMVSPVEGKEKWRSLRKYSDGSVTTATEDRSRASSTSGYDSLSGCDHCYSSCDEKHNQSSEEDCVLNLSLSDQESNASRDVTTSKLDTTRGLASPLQVSENEEVISPYCGIQRETPSPELQRDTEIQKSTLKHYSESIPSPEIPRETIGNYSESQRDTPRNYSESIPSPEIPRETIGNYSEIQRDTPRNYSESIPSPEIPRETIGNYSESQGDTPKNYSESATSPEIPRHTIENYSESQSDTPRNYSESATSPGIPRETIGNYSESQRDTPRKHPESIPSPGIPRDTIGSYSETLNDLPKNYSESIPSPGIIKYTFTQSPENTVKSTPSPSRNYSEWEVLQSERRDTVLVQVKKDDAFSPDDVALRSRVLVLLWVLLGEHRLREVGYPVDPVHRILWRAVDVCCSVAGVKTAAAVPLNGDHDCGSDMTCFRDHTHRFLEVCAPTREHWKQFGWASLTVDAVLRKIYVDELEPLLRLHVLPPDIRGAVTHLAQHDRPSPVIRSTRADHRQQPTVIVPTKKKRGRPAKISHKVDEGGRVERVMLWRFLLNLLEDPRNQACIHWVQREEGIFRILNTDWLARLWGRRHGNPRMTYEKMARAMRTYYRSKVLQPVPRLRNLPRKLVYKFNPAVIQKVAAMKLSCSTFTGRGLNYNK